MRSFALLLVVALCCCVAFGAVFKSGLPRGNTYDDKTNRIHDFNTEPGEVNVGGIVFGGDPDGPSPQYIVTSDDPTSTSAFDDLSGVTWIRENGRFVSRHDPDKQPPPPVTYGQYILVFTNQTVTVYEEVSPGSGTYEATGTYGHNIG